MATTNREIKYLGKNFDQFKTNLLDLAKTYFNNTFNNIDPSDPSMMLIEMASYVGDTLSFYMDVQLKEMILLYAEEKKNVLQLAQSLGYKPRLASPSFTYLDIYQIVPSIGSGASNVPDYDYALKIKPNFQVSSIEDSSIIFRTVDELNFSLSSSFNPTEVQVYQLEAGEPITYLLKKSIKVQSGTQKTSTFTFTDPIKYNSIDIPDTNVISIDSIVDTNNNKWYEVDYLAQDTIFEKVSNIRDNDPELYQYNNQTPYLLKLKHVPKRFITRYNNDFSIKLQFGSGIATDNDEYITPNPDNIGLTTPTGINRLNYSWDVSNFLYTTAYGEVPYNTTLTVTYTVGGGLSNNVIPNVLKNVYQVEFDNDTTSLDPTLFNMAKKSLAVNNPSPATGGKNTETVDEIRLNALANFSAQQRTVTREDYIMRSYSMPQEFGSIAKAYIVQDEQLSLLDVGKTITNPSTLNLYILSYNINKQLTQANNVIKENLKVYLDKYRSITDSINIKDAYIINVKCYFEISVLPDYKAKEVLLYCITELQDHFNIEKWEINQPIVITDVIRKLATVKGVQSVLKVEFENMFDETLGYSPNIYDLKAATRNQVIYPSIDPSIFEIRGKNSDITGKVVQY